MPCGLQHLLLSYVRGHADTPDGHKDACKRLYRRLYSLLWVSTTSVVVWLGHIIHNLSLPHPVWLQSNPGEKSRVQSPNLHFSICPKSCGQGTLSKVCKRLPWSWWSPGTTENKHCNVHVHYPRFSPTGVQVNLWRHSCSEVAMQLHLASSKQSPYVAYFWVISTSSWSTLFQHFMTIFYYLMLHKIWWKMFNAVITEWIFLLWCSRLSLFVKWAFTVGNTLVGSGSTLAHSTLLM